MAQTRAVPKSGCFGNQHKGQNNKNARLDQVAQTVAASNVGVGIAGGQDQYQRQFGRLRRLKIEKAKIDPPL